MAKRTAEMNKQWIAARRAFWMGLVGVSLSAEHRVYAEEVVTPPLRLSRDIVQYPLEPAGHYSVVEMDSSSAKIRRVGWFGKRRSRPEECYIIPCPEPIVLP